MYTLKKLSKTPFWSFLFNVTSKFYVKILRCLKGGSSCPELPTLAALARRLPLSKWLREYPSLNQSEKVPIRRAFSFRIPKDPSRAFIVGIKLSLDYFAGIRPLGARPLPYLPVFVGHRAITNIWVAIESAIIARTGTVSVQMPGAICLGT